MFLAENGSSLEKATASSLCSRTQIRREMLPLSTDFTLAKND